MPRLSENNKLNIFFNLSISSKQEGSALCRKGDNESDSMDSQAKDRGVGEPDLPIRKFDFPRGQPANSHRISTVIIIIS
ncbi:hypothetical protein AYI69_g268 [Smittium culicis]|uniref:Uncharacterized protein n=1 Tax=Smittium culicis TaxID=133412 RepID=A0A1R1YTJ7_9FUNG|nr:hypothetical protein AYI69_g268 [Smittium culicis]